MGLQEADRKILKICERGWLIRDLFFAFRPLRKSPVFTLTAILLLLLGIGATAAMYSFIDALIMRALPVSDPQTLVIVDWGSIGPAAVAHSQHGDGYSTSGAMTVSGTFPYPVLPLLRDHSDVLAGLFAFMSTDRLTLGFDNQAFVGEGEYVSGDFSELSASARSLAARSGAMTKPRAAVPWALSATRFGRNILEQC